MRRAIREYAQKTRLALVLAAVLGAGAHFAFQNAHATDDKAAKPAPQVHVDQTPVNRDAKTTTSFAPVVKKVSPAVVRVDILGKAREAQMGMTPFDDPFFRRFFGDQMPNNGRRGPRMQPPRERGMGSGVIVTQDGYIITNNHVVENADKVNVKLDDGREFEAKVVGTDPKTDIAVVKVEATGLPYINLADSDKIEVGDVVLAIGNPFGVGQTVTSGIVSATGRAMNIGLDYEDFIQTDAAINPGNSGGALIDAQGRLIGINTAILSRSGGNNGIGFAVPVNLAKNVMDQLVTNGKVTRGFLGVNIQNIDQRLQKSFDLKDSKGALVSDVTPNSPAAKAGLKSGDVIVEFNGKPVRDSRQLKLAVGGTSPGTKAPVKILREGSEKSVTVTLKELEGDQLASNSGAKSQADTDALEGVVVADLDANMRQQFDLPRDVKGAVVTDVEQDSASYAAGLRPGDVILEIDRKPVISAEDAVKLSENIKNKSSILLRVWSKGGSHYLVVDESKVG
jgi:serine protease Do